MFNNKDFRDNLVKFGTRNPLTLCDFRRRKGLLERFCNTEITPFVRLVGVNPIIVYLITQY